jgi:AcrR family transcriptional regulator
MTRRATLVDETRQQITAATARLHTTIGPANTTIAGIAEEAGVTRLTVYRHFPDLDTLFEACRAHWRHENPPPDAAAWAVVPALEDRLRLGFTDLYTWFGEHAEELFPIYRDMDVSPRSSQTRMRGENRRLADLLLKGQAPAGQRGVQTIALVRHLIDYRTWRSLVIDQELSGADAVDLTVRMVLRALS